MHSSTKLDKIEARKLDKSNIYTFESEVIVALVVADGHYLIHVKLGSVLRRSTQ